MVRQTEYYSNDLFYQAYLSVNFIDEKIDSIATRCFNLNFQIHQNFCQTGQYLLYLILFFAFQASCSQIVFFKILTAQRVQVIVFVFTILLYLGKAAVFFKKKNSRKMASVE